MPSSSIFSTPELNRVLADMHCVLKDGGVLLAIFKTKIRDYPAFHRETGIDIRLLDVDEGKVLVDDPLLPRPPSFFASLNCNDPSELLRVAHRKMHKRERARGWVSISNHTKMKG